MTDKKQVPIEAQTVHDTYKYVNTDTLVLSNGGDPSCVQPFKASAEFFAFVRKLINDGNEHFGTNAQLHFVSELDVSKLDWSMIDGTDSARGD